VIRVAKATQIQRVLLLKRRVFAVNQGNGKFAALDEGRVGFQQALALTGAV